VKRRRGLIAAAAGIATAAWLAAPGPASAHGIVQRADVPIPEWLFGWAAAAVLVVSFIMLAAFWPQPKLEEDSWRPVKNPVLRGIASTPAQIVYGAIGAFFLGVTLWAGFAGVQTPAANFSVTFVYVIIWNGFVLLAVLFGDVFRAFNPWRATAKCVAWVAEKAAGQPMPAALKYPGKLGYWPAVAGLFAFAVLELVVDDGTIPRNIAIATLIYSVLTWVGMLLYGIDDWLDRGEAFSVYFNLFSRISPWERRDGVLGVRRPLSGLAHFKPGPGIVPFLAVMIGGVTFDGFKEGPVFTDWSVDLQKFFKEDLSLAPKTSLELTNMLGLIFCVLVIGGFYRLGIAGAKSVGGGFNATELGRKFVHSLVPIALAYVAAHYMTQLLFQSQAMAYLASDPLGHGWNLFGGRDSGIDFGIIGATATWYWQVGFIVLGHVLGLTLAHDRALAMYDDARIAVRSQYWMLGVMVGFTCLALWLLSQANS
jgi:hypothetical protein